MDYSLWFSLAGPLAGFGWLALLLSPLAPRATKAIAALLVPLLLSVAYAVLILVYWPSAAGGFDSLDAVMKLFESPAIALAGWLHYLAFDLLVGAWEVRTAREDGLPHLLLIPCLVLTFLFGPVGFLLFQMIRASRTLVTARPQEA